MQDLGNSQEELQLIQYLSQNIIVWEMFGAQHLRVSNWRLEIDALEIDLCDVPTCQNNNIIVTQVLSLILGC